jgi:thioesterase domain-containing protein
MANQLLKLGEKISLLALIDTTANIEKFKTIDIADESLLLSELTHHFTAKSSAQKGNLSFKEQFVRFIENGGRTAVKQEHSSIDRLIALAKSNYRALQAFSIPSIDTKIVLIRTQANPEKTKSLGWNKYTKKLKIFHAPGNHWAITQDDQADHYSQILQKCFASLEKETNLSVV